MRQSVYNCVIFLVFGNPFIPSLATEPTPPAFPKNGGSLKYGTDCSFYGSNVKELQDSQKTVEEKADTLGKNLCQLAQRLECIPNRGTNSGILRNIQLSLSSLYRFRIEKAHASLVTLIFDLIAGEGSCKCLRAFGETSIYLKAGSAPKAGCFIRIGSPCGIDLALPYGLTAKDGKKTVKDTTNLCVPNAKCSTSTKSVC
jgi:hypothetical protein